MLKCSLCSSHPAESRENANTLHPIWLPSSQRTHHGLRGLSCVYTTTPSHFPLSCQPAIPACFSWGQLVFHCISSASSAAPSLFSERRWKRQGQTCIFDWGGDHSESVKIKQHCLPPSVLPTLFPPALHPSIHLLLISSNPPVLPLNLKSGQFNSSNTVYILAIIEHLNTIKNENKQSKRVGCF